MVDINKHAQHETYSLANTLRWCINSKKAMSELDLSLQKIRANLDDTMARLERQRFILEHLTDLRKTSTCLSELTKEVETLLAEDALPYIDAQIDEIKRQLSNTGH